MIQLQLHQLHICMLFPGIKSFPSPDATHMAFSDAFPAPSIPLSPLALAGSHPPAAYSGFTPSERDGELFVAEGLVQISSGQKVLEL
jgi:hypothetical protein